MPGCILRREDLAAKVAALSESEAAHAAAQEALAEQQSIVGDLRTATTDLKADLECKQAELASMSALCEQAEVGLVYMCHLHLTSVPVLFCLGCGVRV